MLIDPLRTNIFFDSCAFDNSYHEEDKFAKLLLKNQNLNILVTWSTVKEIVHPNTPDKTKNMSSNLIQTIQTNLTLLESNLKKMILDILTGNGKRENMEKDTEHFFEACKYGSYFITTDQRILKKSNSLYNIGISCRIMLPSEFYKVVKDSKKQYNLEKQIKLLHAKHDQYVVNSPRYKILDNESIKLENE